MASSVTLYDIWYFPLFSSHGIARWGNYGVARHGVCGVLGHHCLPKCALIFSYKVVCCRAFCYMISINSFQEWVFLFRSQEYFPKLYPHSTAVHCFMGLLSRLPGRTSFLAHCVRLYLSHIFFSSHRLSSYFLFLLLSPSTRDADPGSLGRLFFPLPTAVLNIKIGLMLYSGVSRV